MLWITTIIACLAIVLPQVSGLISVELVFDPPAEARKIHVETDMDEPRSIVVSNRLSVKESSFARISEPNRMVLPNMTHRDTLVLSIRLQTTSWSDGCPVSLPFSLEAKKIELSCQGAAIIITYNMQCESQFYGSRCDSWCRSLPGDHFDCGQEGERICRPGWGGANCSTPSCIDSPCQNGGHCQVLPNHHLQCTCSSSFEGKHCERRRITTTTTTTTTTPTTTSPRVQTTSSSSTVTKPGRGESSNRKDAADSEAPTPLTPDLESENAHLSPDSQEAREGTPVIYIVGAVLVAFLLLGLTVTLAVFAARGRFSKTKPPSDDSEIHGIDNKLSEKKITLRHSLPPASPESFRYSASPRLMRSQMSYLPDGTLDHTYESLDHGQYMAPSPSFSSFTDV